ncbi:alpha/beta hydrolase [Paenibacillus albiflavus]|uniref:Alpha/beta hydrolase n=1 Tax=Paenibacillus albiflavus TaxID=2545760 RepID=A0A4R4EG92_9BACL|nr:alpha/beta hydrolase [Paenibacillus albiflavus]TCZ78313.1 alpha/beta hydrolase [Paenibacillus albiflavus]
MALHYQEYGDKNADLMVFLHGGGVSGWMWDKQIQYFTNFHCVVPDLPEQGQSNDEVDFSIKNSADQLIELIQEKATGKKVIVIGFSLGAQVTIQLMSMKPDLIDFAIINSALVRPITSIKKWIRPSIRLTSPLMQNRLFAKLQAKTLYVNGEYFEKYYKESSQMKSDTLIRILEENMSFEIPKDFQKANGKILVTVGEREKAVMKKSAKDIVASNSNCSGVIIPQIGHGISMAKPDFFNQMIETWIHKGSLPEGEKIIG